MQPLALIRSLQKRSMGRSNSPILSSRPDFTKKKELTEANELSYIPQTSGTINRHDFIKWVKPIPTPDKSDTQQ
eukprot:scaffold7684_cov119-Isochrysis_galbana.AAC.3